jgi:hypothetical protein
MCNGISDESPVRLETKAWRAPRKGSTVLPVAPHMAEVEGRDDTSFSQVSTHFGEAEHPQDKSCANFVLK